MKVIDQNISEISQLCEAHGVKHLYGFGSVFTHSYNNKSDIDLIVNFKDIDLLDYADNYFTFKFSLEDILKRPIDLLEEKLLRILILNNRY